MSQNITAAANDLRPAQARVNLETMIIHQVELRRSESKAIREKCDLLESMLLKLKVLTGSLDVSSSIVQADISVKTDKGSQLHLLDALQWAQHSCKDVTGFMSE